MMIVAPLYAHILGQQIIVYAVVRAYSGSVTLYAPFCMHVSGVGVNACARCMRISGVGVDACTAVVCAYLGHVSLYAHILVTYPCMRRCMRISGVIITVLCAGPGSVSLLAPLYSYVSGCVRLSGLVSQKALLYAHILVTYLCMRRCMRITDVSVIVCAVVRAYPGSVLLYARILDQCRCVCPCMRQCGSGSGRMNVDVG